MPTLVWCALLTMSGLHFPADAAAQATDPDPVRVTIRGVVLDAVTGTAVPGAVVYLAKDNYGALSDSLGKFRIDDVATGSQTVSALQFGYEEIAAVVELPEAGAFMEIELTPRPILLEGVTAVVDSISTMQKRLRSRRRSAPYQTRAFDQEKLLRSPSSNVLDFLSRETYHRTVPCRVDARFTGWNSAQVLGWGRRPTQVAGALSSRCILRRGSYVSPRVYIDETPVIGGLDELESYPTAQIYLMEVYSAGGEIRAYTYNFMQRMAEKPMSLIPISLWP